MYELFEEEETKPVPNPNSHYIGSGVADWVGDQYNRWVKPAVEQIPEMVKGAAGHVMEGMAEYDRLQEESDLRTIRMVNPDFQPADDQAFVQSITDTTNVDPRIIGAGIGVLGMLSPEPELFPGSKVFSKLDDVVPAGLDDLLSDIRKVDVPPPKVHGTTFKPDIEPYHNAPPITGKRTSGKGAHVMHLPGFDQANGNARQYLLDNGTWAGFEGIVDEAGVKWMPVQQKGLKDSYDSFASGGSGNYSWKNPLNKINLDKDRAKKLGDRQVYPPTFDELKKENPNPKGSKSKHPDGSQNLLHKENHHIRGATLYNNFFKDASPEDTRSLAKYAYDELMRPIADDVGNSAWIEYQPHKGIKGLPRDQRVGFHEGYERKPFNNYINSKKKNHPEFLRQRFPKDMSNMSLAQRKELLKQFLFTKQSEADKALFIEMMAYKHPDSPEWQELARAVRNNELDLSDGPNPPMHTGRGTKEDLPKRLPGKSNPDAKLKPKPSRKSSKTS